MKLLLTGGGSGGPVAPLIAVADEIRQKHPQTAFLLIGTHGGPEGAMAERAKIPFETISAGKLRRYFSPANLIAPFSSIAGFFQSLRIIKEFNPDCLLGSGSFVQVPVVWAAWFMKVPVVIHQQDIVPSLANRLCQNAADKITVTFKESLTDFSSSLGLFYKRGKDKVSLTGNPFRSELAKAEKPQAQKYFNLNEKFPVLLVLGGGTGAQFLNDLIRNALPELSRVVQIIHSTGQQKGTIENMLHYRSFKFISEMGQAYAAADIVLCRAGLSTITELSNLGKVSIIIPMPGTHQEINAQFLYQHKAAIILDQQKLNAEGLIKVVRQLLFEHSLQQNLIINIGKIMPKNSAAKIADLVSHLAETKRA